MHDDAYLQLLSNKPLFDVEVSSMCNAKCTFCPRTQLNFVNGIMNCDTMRTISEWIPSNSSIILSGMGEPLLNPNIEYFIKKLKLRENDVSIITNGSLLNRKRIERLIESNVDEIQVSFQTTVKEKYQSVMVGLEQNIVMKNIELLQSLGSKKIKLRLNSVCKMTKKEEGEFVKYAKNNGFTPFIRTMHSRGGLLYTPDVKKTGCGIFPSTTFISWDGGIKRCSNDRLGDDIGNIFEDNFNDILALKEKILKDHVPQICRNCDDEYRWIILESKNVHEIRPFH
jgi:Molybdenum cofactor biosynthesis enzyme